MRETVARHTLDMELRVHGFRIHSRPKDGPTMWTRGGKFYTQQQAEQYMDRLRRGGLKT